MRVVALTSLEVEWLWMRLSIAAHFLVSLTQARGSGLVATESEILCGDIAAYYARAPARPVHLYRARRRRCAHV